MQFAIYHLLLKDLAGEWKQLHTAGGTFLYAIATAFIVYLTFTAAEPPVWNALFWIILVFAAMNAISSAFSDESGRQNLFYYTLCSPESLIISKIIFYAVYLLAIGLLTFSMLALILGSPVVQFTMFIGGVLAGAIALATALTFIASLAAKTNRASTMLALLGFPVIIPILLSVVRITAASMFPTDFSEVLPDFLILLSTQLLLLAMCLLLYPFVWRS